MGLGFKPHQGSAPAFFRFLLSRCARSSRSCNKWGALRFAKHGHAPFHLLAKAATWGALRLAKRETRSVGPCALQSLATLLPPPPCKATVGRPWCRAAKLHPATTDDPVNISPRERWTIPCGLNKCHPPMQTQRPLLSRPAASLGSAADGRDASFSPPPQACRGKFPGPSLGGE